MKVFEPDLPGLKTKIFLKRMIYPKTKDAEIDKGSPRNLHIQLVVPRSQNAK
jgi:hypothetical protein